MPAGLLILGLGVVVPGAVVSSAEGAPTCTKRGTARSETIRGTSGRDVLCGFGGNDVLLGLGGNDVLLGGDGNDRLLGGRGSDVLTGGRGTDTVSYSDRTAGVRVTIGSLANDGTAGEGDNVQADIERVEGGAGADRLFAGSRAAQLRGFGGPDRLFGGPARDTLIGDSGADFLDGKALGDTYKCGSGFDTWVKSGPDSPAIDCEDQFGNQAPHGIGFDNNGDVFENQPVGTLVDTLNASDPDPGDVLTLSLPAGVFDNDKFSIVGKQLLTDEVFDFETTPELQIQIRVTDKGGLFYSVTAPIPVKDLNDPPSPADDQVNGVEDTPLHIQFSTLLANDTDQDGDQFALVATDSPVNGAVTFAPADEQVIFTPNPDFCGSGAFDYLVQDTHLATAWAHVEVVLECGNDGAPAGVVERQHAVTGNVAIDVPAGSLLQGVTDVDGDTLVVQEATGVSAQGGSFDVDADGSWTYVPPAGYTGSDSFPYQVCDFGSEPQLCAGASVVLTVSGMVWFVDNEANPGGNGTVVAPFATLAAFQAVNNGVGTNPGNNDPVFLAASGTPYVGPVVLLSGQRLIGAGSSVSVASAAGLTLAPDSVPLPPTGLAAPQVNTVGGNAVQVVLNNLVRGIRIGGSGGGWGLLGLDFGALTVSEVSVVGGRGAMSLENGSLSGTGFTEVVASGTPVAVRLVNVNGPIPLGTGILAADQTALLIQGGSGAVSYAGQVLGFGSPAGLIVQGRVGQVTLSGLVKDVGSGPGIAYTGVNGGTLTLTGGVEVTAATGTALSATGGGKIEVTGTANTLNATGAPALVVSGGSLIGFQGLRFRSVSSSGSPTSGIVLDGTGIEGGLWVTGTAGPAGTGGGTITGSTGPGISLTNTWTPVIGGMVIQNSGSHGILASGVTNLSLQSNRIENNGNAVDEHGLFASNLAGTQNSLVVNAFLDSFHQQVVIVSTTGNPSIRLSTNTFDSPGGTLGGGIEITRAGVGTTTTELYFSRIRGAVGDAISLRGDGVAATLNGRILANLIGEEATAGSGSSAGSGIRVLGLNGSPVRALIQSNHVVRYANYGILVGTSGGNSNADMIIGNNTIKSPGATALNGVNVVAGQNATSGTLCLSAEQNTLAGSSANGQEEFQVSQADPDVAVVLPGYAGAAHDLVAVENFLKASVPAATADALSTGVGPGYVNGAFCSVAPPP